MGADRGHAELQLCPCGSQTASCGAESCAGCNERKQVIHDYLKIGDFTLFQGDAEMYFKAKYEKREFHNWHDIRVNVYV